MQLFGLLVLAALPHAGPVSAQGFTGVAGFGWAWFDGDRVSSCEQKADLYRLDLPRVLPLERRHYFHTVGSIIGYGVFVDVVNGRVVGVNVGEGAAQHQRLSWFFRMQTEMGRRPCLMLRGIREWKSSAPPPNPLPEFHVKDDRYGDSLDAENTWTDPGYFSGTLDVGGVRLTWTPTHVAVELLKGCCSDNGCKVVRQSQQCPAGSSESPLAESSHDANLGLCSRCRPGTPRAPAPPDDEPIEPPDVCCINGRAEPLSPEHCRELVGGIVMPPGSSCETEQINEPEPEPPVDEPQEPPPVFGGCCDQLGMCSVATALECRRPLLYLEEGCGAGCPTLGACRDIPCPRSTDTLCAETTEAQCAEAGGQFDAGGGCDPRDLGGSCPAATPCDVLDGTTWYDSCGAAISVSVEDDDGLIPGGGTVLSIGRTTREGTWRCDATPGARRLDITWADGERESRELQLIDDYRLAFVDPGLERLHWMEEPTTWQREGAAISEVAKDGSLTVELDVINCAAQPLRPTPRWQGAEEATAEPPPWLYVERFRSTPEELPARSRGTVRLQVAPTTKVAAGDWISVSVESAAGDVESEHRFIRVRDKRLENTGLILEKTSSQ